MIFSMIWAAGIRRNLRFAVFGDIDDAVVKTMKSPTGTKAYRNVRK
jgi:hypothetical protein